MARSRSCPSGSTAAGSFARSSSPMTASASRASSRTLCCSRHCHGGRSMFSTKPVRERTCAPTAALSSTSSSASGRVVWNTVANPCRARRCGGQRVTSCPSMRTTPLSTRWNPEMQPRRVDFPAPFGPMRHVSEPAATSSETSSTALTAPNDFVTPVSSHAGCGSDSAASGREAAATYSGYLKHVRLLLVTESRRRGCGLPP